MDFLWGTSNDIQYKKVDTRDALQHGKKMVTVINETPSTVSLSARGNLFDLKANEHKDVVLEDTSIEEWGDAKAKRKIPLKDLKADGSGIITHIITNGSFQILSVGLTSERVVLIRYVWDKYKYIRVTNKSSKYITATIHKAKFVGDKWTSFRKDILIPPCSSLCLHVLAELRNYEGKRVFSLEDVCDKKLLTWVCQDQEFEYLTLDNVTTITVKDNL